LIVFDFVHQKVGINIITNAHTGPKLPTVEHLKPRSAWNDFSPGVELVNPEQICYKLILAPY